MTSRFIVTAVISRIMLNKIPQGNDIVFQVTIPVDYMTRKNERPMRIANDICNITSGGIHCFLVEAPAGLFYSMYVTRDHPFFAHRCLEKPPENIN